jgi:beta-glucosidase
VACIEPVQAVTASSEDCAAASYFSELWNGTTTGPLFKGQYPAQLDDLFGPCLKAHDLATIRQPTDFLGLNYYNQLHIKHDETNPFGAGFGPPPAANKLTAMGWAIEPNGLYKQLIDLKTGFGNPAVYIAENGAAYDDSVGPDGAVHDPSRIGYIRAHLVAAQKAKREGANLQGYFVWSLLDNFEWTEGMGKRFGIVHVDFKTLKRTPKDSWHWFARHLRR